MADGTVIVQQALTGDRPIDNIVVINDVGATVYRQRVAVSGEIEIANDSGNPIPVHQSSSLTAVTTRVASSATVVTLLAANAQRNQATIYNESTQTLFLKFGPGASMTDYTLPITGSGYYELPIRYGGELTGLWTSANGFAMVTEF